MRPRLPALRLAEVVLAAALLQAVPAQAQPSGWVDPPAKSAPESAAKGTGELEAKSERPDPKPAATVAGRESGKAATREAARPELARQERAEGPARGAGSEQVEAPSPRRTAEQPHRRPLAQTISERRRAARETAAFSVAPSASDAGGRDPGLVAWAGQAQRLADAYLDNFSAPNAQTLAATPRFYGESVRFYGRTMSTAALVAEKRRFLQRWPERRYAARDGSMRTSCSAAAAACIVRTVMGFSAGNPARGARSQGVSELSLTVSFAGARPVIVAESSRVLRRGAAALSALASDPRG